MTPRPNPLFKTTRRAGLALAAAALAGLALSGMSVAAARPFGRGPLPRAGGFEPLRHVLALAERMDLSDDQRSEIRTILRSHREEVRALAKREKEARFALVDAIRQAVPNEAAVRAASATVAAADADAAVLRARVWSEVWAVLTPDQREELTAALDELREDVNERIGRLVDLLGLL